MTKSARDCEFGRINEEILNGELYFLCSASVRHDHRMRSNNAYPRNNHLFKVNTKNTRKSCDWHQWCRSVFIVNFEPIHNFF